MTNVLDEKSMRGFSAWLSSEEKSEGTIENYLRHIQKLAVFLAGRELTKDALIQWKQSLEKVDYKPTTINSMLISANAYLKYIGQPGWCVKTLKIQKKLFREQSREITRSDYEKLVATAQMRNQHRLALLLETICATGIRVSEVKYITVDAVLAGRAVVELKGKIRTILLPGKLCRKLSKYAKKQKIVSGEIFITENGNGLNRRQIWAEMKRLCKYAGISESKVFPHNLRHLFATTFYRVQKDIARLADVLGHSSIETTRIYLVTSGEEHLKQLESLRLVT